MNQLLSRVLSFVQMAVIVAALAGEHLAPMLNLPVAPDTIEWIKRNRMGLVLGAWFVGNIVSNSLLGTGAFEVYYNGSKIFSKLATGRAPVVRQVLDRLGDVIRQ